MIESKTLSESKTLEVDYNPGSYKVIYVVEVEHETHKGRLKIGDATFKTDKSIQELKELSISDNEYFITSEDIDNAARKRIDQYTKTIDLSYKLLFAALAVRENPLDKTRYEGFRDYKIHHILERNGLSKRFSREDKTAGEWFEVDINSAKAAILSFIKDEPMKDYSGLTITLRPEQEAAVRATLKTFKNGSVDLPKKMLWNAKMRFGKTLTAYSLIKGLCGQEENLNKVLIITHRPDVNSAWSEDFNKIGLHKEGWKYGSKSNQNTFDETTAFEKFVWFASIQDLRGSYSEDNVSEADFENLKKNDKVFNTDWDLIVTDEAHEGTLTPLAEKMYSALKSKYFLDLSGTPFNLVKAEQWDSVDLNGRFIYDDQYNWSYPDERKAKIEWGLNNPNDTNPYNELPEICFITYDISKSIPMVKPNTKADISFTEFFRTELVNDKAVFVYEDQVQDLLYKMLGSDKHSDSPELFPYNKKFENRFNHTLWMLPNVPACNAMEILLSSQSSGFGGYKIINATGEGTHSWSGAKDAFSAVKNSIKKNPLTITLSQQMLTTGVTVPEWTAVFMMNNKTSPMLYMQTAFRVTSPGSLPDGRTKDIAYVFDFNPDRCLREIVEIATHNAKTSEKADIIEQDKLDKESIAEYLEYVSILSLEGSNFIKPDSNAIMERLNEVYINEVISKGFDSPKLWNSKELDHFDIEKAKLLEALRKLQGNGNSSGEVTVSALSPEAKEQLKELRKKELEAAKDKAAEPLSVEENSQKKQLEEASKKEVKNRQNAVSILAGVAARLPMLVFASPAEETITPENFNLLIDDESWKEFMPKNLHRVMPEGTKSLEERQDSLGQEGLTLYWEDIRRFFNPMIFSLASERIRQMAREADDKPVFERVIRIANLFSNFKNPDKETVLTPWRVVNIQYNNTLGGLQFLDLDNSTNDNVLVWMKDLESGLVESVNIHKAIDLLDNGSHEVSPKWLTVDKDVENVWLDTKATFFDINSKTALYPLFAAASLYYVAVKSVSGVTGARVKEDETWAKTVKRAIFVNCRVPYSKKIAQRVLAGYNSYEINASVVDVIAVRKLVESVRVGDKGKTQLSDEDKAILWRWIFNPKDFRNAERRVEELKLKVKSGTVDDLLSRVRTDVEKSDKFTAVVSNPPYQVSQSGKNSDIWPDFIAVSKNISECGSFIHPARWVIPKKMMIPIQNILISHGLRYFDYLSISPFSNVYIDGNISISKFDFTKPLNKIKYSINGENKGFWNRENIFFTNELEKELYNHFKDLLINNTMDDIRIGVLAALGGQDFGYRKSEQLDKLSKNSKNMENPIKIWANPSFGKGTRFEWFYIDEKDVNKTSDYLKAISTRKVMLDKKGHYPSYLASGNVFNNSAEIVGKNVIASEKVFLVPINDTDHDLLLISSLMTTKTARCLMSITQKDLYVRGLDNIPLYTDLAEELTKDEKAFFTDEWFYSHYEFSEELINYIEKIISDKAFNPNLAIPS